MSRGWTSPWLDHVPFSSPPLGVTRHAASGKLRMIVDGSTGGSLAMNEGILKLYTDFVKWDTIISKLIAAIKRAKAKRRPEVKVWLIKLDVAAVFRNIPIRPEDFHLQVIEWLGKFTVSNDFRCSRISRRLGAIRTPAGRAFSAMATGQCRHCSLGRRLPLRLYRNRGGGGDYSVSATFCGCALRFPAEGGKNRGAFDQSGVHRLGMGHGPLFPDSVDPTWQASSLHSVCLTDTGLPMQEMFR